MICAFLSHSSSDKERYVRIVAEKLGQQQAVYDEYSFEAGLKPLEEIIRGLNESQIFVVFLSVKALESRWVNQEILLAHEKLTANELQRIFPIIIDPALTYLDTRIPQWMRDDYNLKYVARPIVAARRIRQRLREIAWLHNPRLKEKNTIFVGRNALVEQIEQRVDDFDQEVPTCFIASGLPRIGRYALLRHALVKCNIVRDSYEFPSIVLRREDSFEDLLLKLYDLGFSASDYPANLMNCGIEERISIAVLIVQDIQAAHEIVLIHDEGCIINYTRELQSWFDEILRRVAVKQKPTFIVSARHRPRPEALRLKNYLFTITVPELTIQERRGLFKRLTDFEGLALSRDDFAFFTGLFQGFPDQVRFACDMIRDLGIKEARKESHQLTEFNSDKAATILEKYSTQPNALDFLYLLSEFEFISLDFLFSIVPEADCMTLLSEFIAACICDYVGIEKEFVRLNDIIRDYVRRNRMEITGEYRKRLNEHLNDFLTSSNIEDRDISDLLYSIKEGIKAGKSVPDKYLIPSHFLSSIRELYQERGHLDRVIELADMLLAKESLLDHTVAQDVRYYLCLSLARKRDARMLQEVQKIRGPEHNFLLGFYYRLQGRANDSIESLKKCLNFPIVASRAKRELAQVYLSIEEFDLASALAQSNYEENRRNPYHIQTYFNTVVNSREAAEKRELLHQLIEELRSIGSDVAIQMADIAWAEFLAKCDNNYAAACDAADDAIKKYSDSHYPLLVKAFLAARNTDANRLRQACEQLEKMAKERMISDTSLIRLRAYLIVLEGDLDKAIAYAESNLQRCPDYSRSSFLERLREVNTKMKLKAQQASGGHA